MIGVYFSNMYALVCRCFDLGLQVIAHVPLAEASQ